MTRRRPNRILGVALGQKSILVAQVATKGGHREVEMLAEFAVPDPALLERSAELGQALGRFLKEKKFTEREAVFGLPAKCLVTRCKEIPPANPAAAASTLRLQAESEFSAELENLAMDFVGEASAAEARSVLLVATARSYVDRCAAIAKAAGLKLCAISATSAALGRITGRLANGEALVVALARGYAELIVQEGTAPSQLRHLAIGEGPADTSGALAGEIRRAVATLPRNGSPLKLTIWQGPGDAASETALGQRLGMPTSVADLRGLVQTPAGDARGFGPAIALALTALDAGGPPVDFLHSRLTAPIARASRRPIIWGGIAAAVLLAAGLAGFADLQSKESELAGIRMRLAQIDPIVQVARTNADRLNTVTSWSPDRPRFLACLRDVTALFPDDSSIYATGLSLQATAAEVPGKTGYERQTAPRAARELKYVGQLHGVAASRDLAYRLFDRMKESKRFTEPKIGDTPTKGPNGREVSFTISFTYSGGE